MYYEVQFKASVQQDLEQIGPAQGERILRGIYQKLSHDPTRGNVLKLGASELWQYKIGLFTIVYTFGEQSLKVLSILE